MNDFIFSFPTQIIFGKDRHLLVGKRIREHGQKVLLLYGSERLKQNGLLRKLEDLLTASLVEFVTLGGVQPNPTVSLVETGIELCQKENIDCILAVGGGSVIDSAKAISMGRFATGGVWNLFTGKEPIPQQAMPIGVVVTIPATASEANCVAVLSNQETNQKRVVANPACIPKFAILNPELTLSIPKEQTAIAAADIFSHCFERYVDQRRQSRVWDSLCEATMKTVAELTPKLLQKLEDYELRSDMMWAATVAHSDMLGPGGDYACHGLSHVLTSVYGIPHGMALGMILPAWAEHVYTQSPDVFRRFAQNVWGVAEPGTGIKCLKQWVRTIGLPICLAETGMTAFQPKNDAATLAEKAFSDEIDFLGGGLTKIRKKDAIAIFSRL